MDTSDIDKTYQDMKANGVKVEEMMRMPYGTMFQFYDQDGNMYILREDKY